MKPMKLVIPNSHRPQKLGFSENSNLTRSNSKPVYILLKIVMKPKISSFGVNAIITSNKIKRGRRALNWSQTICVHTNSIDIQGVAKVK